MDYFPKQKNQSLEFLRLPGEMAFYQKILDMIPDVLQSLPVVCGDDVNAARLSMMSRCLRLSEKNAPALHQAMKQALQNLNRPDLPYDLFQQTGEENAYTRPYEEHPLITLQGRMLTMLDNTEFMALLGHELGHCFCHSECDNKSSALGMRLILENNGSKRTLQQDAADLHTACKRCENRFVVPETAELLVAADAISSRPSIPALRAMSFRIISAIGERQILP